MKITNIVIFAMLFIFLILAPFLFAREYKTNKEFKELLSCNETYGDFSFNLSNYSLFTEQKGNNKEFCDNMKDLTKKSNFITPIIILFWAGLIFEKDIYPLLKKS